MITETDYNSKSESRAMWKLALYMLWLVVLSSGLIAVNAGMVFAFFNGVADFLPEFPFSNQLVQFVVFIVPILLLYLEWYLWDVFSARRAGGH